MISFLVLAIFAVCGQSRAGCGNFQLPAYAVKINSGNCGANAVRFTCSPGYVMQVVASCTNGIWSYKPECVRLPAPPVPECKTKLDVVFVVDGSRSIGRNHFINMKKNLVEILPSLNVKPDMVNLGALVFSNRVRGRIPLTGNEASLKKNIPTLSYPRRGTRTDFGIIVGQNMLKKGRPGVKDVMVVITDGKSNKPAGTKKAAANARAAGIEVHVIGIGKGIDRKELNDIASSESLVTLADNFDVFKANLLKLIAGVCSG